MLRRTCQDIFIRHSRPCFNLAGAGLQARNDRYSNVILLFSSRGLQWIFERLIAFIRHSGMVQAGIQRLLFSHCPEKTGFPIKAFGNDEKVSL